MDPKLPVCKAALRLLDCLTICIILVFGISTLSLAQATANPTTQPRARSNFGNLPVAFEVNQGQADKQVKYLARTHGYTLFLTSSEAIFSIPSNSSNSSLFSVRRDVGPSEMRGELRPAKAESSTPAVLRMRMLGANAAAAIDAEEEQPGRINYLIGNNPRGWHQSVPRYARVHYRGVYPGIDAVYHGAQPLEFDFVVRAGADPDRIRLEFRGEQGITTDKSGNLVLTLPTGEMRLLKPVAYQEQNGVRQAVSANFVVKTKHEVAFVLGPYDRTRQLVIDPSIIFATYFGGDQQETGLGVALDANGNAYVVGTTNSNLNILSLPANQLIPPGGMHDCYLVQFLPSGAVGFITVFGGSSDDLPQAVTVDSTGIYVAGTTQSADFPVSSPNASGPAQSTFAGAATEGDAFVAKLKPNGSAIQWATYLGGTGFDVAFAVAVDNHQNVFVAGETFSTTTATPPFPIANALPQGSTNNGGADGFVTEINPDGSAFLMSSYIGGANLDFATGVVWNATTGNVYVSGATQSPNLPTTATAFQKTCGTDSNCNASTGSPRDDGFVAAFNPNATAPLQYTYLTYLGGEWVDDALAITTDATGNAYVTGKTGSAKFPLSTSPTPYQNKLNGQQNAFVSVLNPSGSALVYSTYLGGEGSDKGLGIALDASNNVYVTGQTSSTAFPTANATQSTFAGGNTGPFPLPSDAFLSELSVNGSSVTLPFSTYIGGAGDEDIFGGFVAVDSAQGNIFVVGDTNSTNFPVQASAGTPVADSSLNDGQGAKPTCLMFDVDTQQQFTVVCPDAFLAVYSANSSGISVALAGTGAGTVTSSPAGINCPGTGTCSGSFATNNSVTLTATPNSASTFTGWSGAGCSATAPCSITLNINQAVTANFTLIPTFTLAGSALTPSTISAGSAATSTMTVTSVGGFNSSIAFSCSVTPAVVPAPTCSAPAVTPAANGTPATATLTVSTIGPTAALRPASNRPSGLWHGMWLPVAGLAFVGFGGVSKNRKKLFGLAIFIMLLCGTLFLVACGGGNSSSTGGRTGTPAGTYTVTVTGTAGSTTVNAHSLTLTVQ